MKKLAVLLAASAFAASASAAYACPYSSAKLDKNMTVVEAEKPAEAMSTYDPAERKLETEEVAE